MQRWLGRVAVVTGASVGIGAAIVENLVESGMRVVGLARREEKLMEMKDRLKGKSGSLYPLPTDITKDNDVKAAFKWVQENLGGVDVLINNAGVLVPGSTLDGCVDDWRKVYEVNVLALGTCSWEALKLMKKNNVDDGHIINIISIAAHRKPVIQGTGAYPSSKHASKAITESLRIELAAQNSKIKITSISPGLVATEIFEANSNKYSPDISKKPHLEPKDIADAVHYTLTTPPNVLVNELIIIPVGDGN